MVLKNLHDLTRGRSVVGLFIIVELFERYKKKVFCCENVLRVQGTDVEGEGNLTLCLFVQGSAALTKNVRTLKRKLLP